jgi:type IV pilus assembly protein PilQ
MRDCYRLIIYKILLVFSLLGIINYAQIACAYSESESILKETRPALQAVKVEKPSSETIVGKSALYQNPNTPVKVAASTPSDQKKQADSTNKVVNSDTKNTKKNINAINVSSAGVEIIANAGIDNFKTFRMSKPQRLIVDIFEATTTITGNKVPINRFGIVNARLGGHPDKIRIVLDSSAKTFPTYSIEKSDNGLMIAFADRDKAQEAQHNVEVFAVKSTATPVSRKTTATIESIDFKVTDGYSQIIIKSNETLDISKPRKTADGITLTARNSILPEKLQRPFDTKAFNSSVLKITPYQVRTRSGYDTKILIKLRQDAPFELKSEDNIARIEIKNPEIPETAPMASVTQTAPPVVAVKTPEPELREGDITHPGAGKKAYTGRRVTLEFADADIRKIFQLIAEVSNLNFLLGDDVTGTISIKLVNVPWDQALDVILETKGLGMKREGNIVLIKPVGKIQTLADEKQAEKKALERAMDLKTRVFDINYASVSDIATQFNSVKSERGIIAQDARTNRVIVTDIEPAIEKMTALLKALDIPEKQVMIEARIVEASSTFTRDLGIQWGIHTSNSTDVNAGFGGVLTGVAPTDPGSTFGPGAAASITFGSFFSNGTLDLKLSAAASTGLIKIISTPKVVTLNNKAAKIAQGQSIPYQTVSAEGTKTEFVEAALTLEVTPHITADGSVSMKIKATNNTAGTGSPPPINKKEATTEMLVKNGETTVIGGIYVDNDTEIDDGVPFLMDIPLLGWLFKSNSKLKQKTELLIFITPKIVS